MPLIDSAHNVTHALLFEGLPVVFVSDWRTVTHRFLEERWRVIQLGASRGEYDVRKVYFPYWLNQLTGL